jgi:ABC-type amino acid transport system permease subunit
MFPPVGSQVIVLSKETPIVSVGLRTAEVSYTNQNKTAWKSEVVQTLGW